IKTGSEDYKSMLQRFIQQSPLDILEYKLVSEDGPAHERIFTSCAVLNNNVIGTGTAPSKRQSEQLAAYEALKLFDALETDEKS
ncbi:MAG TPA: putative dsRNA-binding protein, partial [Bacillota bacterium]|nr:putative dsRNA-binding protein [Bacillota bacterium]